MELRELQVKGWERVLVAREGAYHGIIAIHSRTLGPAIGGTRLWQYASEDEALNDALRLSRGMTYKNAMAGLPAGGGKSVMLLPPAVDDRDALLRAHARVVEQLGGEYITAEDVGTSPRDMDVMAQVTRHVAGTTAGSGDPSPRTARGVFRAIQAGVRHRYGRDDLAGLRVAIQGCGNVGAALAAELARAGARLVLADVDAARAARVAAEVGGEVIAPAALPDAEAEVLAPCALGATLNPDTIPRLRCAVIAGGANNQLLDADRDGALLHARGILYVPDYVANAGGVITGCGEMFGHPRAWGTRRVEAIYHTVLEVLGHAEARGILPHQAADAVAEARIAQGAVPA